MANTVKEISNSTGTPEHTVRRILEEFIEETGVARNLDREVLEDIRSTPPQPTLDIFAKEDTAA